ncbi:MAG: sigma-70 family RNA polymerase sigma factor [Thermoguttaceae bacterium]
MTLLQNGNQEAFTVLYHRYHRKVKGNICNRLHGELLADADDLTQQVFLALHKCTRRFIQDSYVSSYLLATTHRLLVNHLQYAHRLRRDIRRESRTVPETMDDVRGAEKAEAAQLVNDFLSRLTPAEREIVRMLDLEHYTAKTAAELLDMPITTVQWRHRKAWEHLKDLAAEEMEEQEREVVTV